MQNQKFVSYNFSVTNLKRLNAIPPGLA